MCGINGFNFLDKEQIKLMNAAIKHRGPDDKDVFADEKITLGHVRLSIQDLSQAGRQPMTCEHNGKMIVIVFNGEIYNFLEIRAELEKIGYKFKSKSDTEVILASYFEWGCNCVDHFNGMWSFVLYDPSKKILFCSRDRLGVKPLYYFYDGERFIFSSELKGILANKNLFINQLQNINQDALDLYFALGYIPSPYTIYNHTFKIEPMQNLIFNLENKTIEKSYYYKVPKYDPSFNSDKLLKEGRELLKDAVKLRLIADVPVGALLSGGIDSSTVVGTMREFVDSGKLHTFSIGFEGNFDETPFIDIAAKDFRTLHNHYYFDQNDFDELIDSYAYFYDEPFCDIAGFPTFKICQMAREQVTVALSGDGGDEIFGGYHRYIVGYRLNTIRKIPRFLRVLFSKLPAKENLNGYTSLYWLKKAFNVSLFDQKLFYEKALENQFVIPQIYREWTAEKLDKCMDLGGNNFAEVLRLFDLLFNTLADNYLVKVDRASMAYALEVRSPFLDYRFIEYSQKIPTEWKVDMRRSKKFMKKLIKGIVPEEIRLRRKKGFVPPLELWILDQKYASTLLRASEYLKDLNPVLYKFFKEKALIGESKIYSIYKIRLFLFAKWFERWITESQS